MKKVMGWRWCVIVPVKLYVSRDIYVLCRVLVDGSCSSSLKE